MMNEIPDIAPEQYELQERATRRFSISRRQFFQTLGSGLAVAFVTGRSVAGTLAGDAVLPEDQIGAWIHINEEGRVTVYSGKVEVGQNIRTSLAQAVADELEVRFEDVAMVLGDTALTPYDRGTFGSRTTPYMAPQLRKAAASARELLIDMAAKEMNTTREQLYAADGGVKDRKSGKSMAYGKLTKGKELIKRVNEQISTKPVSEWKVAGTSVRKVNGVSFVTGKHEFVSDMTLPGMLVGKILRPPAYGAKLSSIDLSAAKAMKDVVVVHDGDFVGVAAPDTRTATRALQAIKAGWRRTEQPSREAIFDYLKSNAETPRDDGTHGDVASALANAGVTIARTFYVDYIAHAPMEPRAGLAEWKDGKLTVWTGTQRPFGVQEVLSELFEMPAENIRVIQPDTGAAYGGKHTGEAGIEAARLALAAKKPVKVVWTREEEFTWAYFRPAGVIEVKAGATREGKVTAWEFHNYNSGASGIQTPYEVADRRIQFHRVASPLRQGSYRGLASTANIFARESAMDDLADALGIDPLEFRLMNLKDERMRGVLEAVATRFGWKNYKARQGRAAGVGCGTEKNGYCATIAEVAVDSDGNVKVLRAVVAFDCGAIVNPDHLKSQIQGSVIQGLGGALFERIDFKDGRILNAGFARYRVPRFGDTPELEVIMVNKKEIPSAGGGETPIVGIAPAVRNAIAAATGKKLYTLPLVPDGLKM